MIGVSTIACPFINTLAKTHQDLYTALTSAMFVYDFVVWVRFHAVNRHDRLINKLYRSLGEIALRNCLRR
jgi:hypothetical protein